MARGPKRAPRAEREIRSVDEWKKVDLVWREQNQGREYALYKARMGSCVCVYLS